MLKNLLDWVVVRVHGLKCKIIPCIAEVTPIRETPLMDQVAVLVFVDFQLP